MSGASDNWTEVTGDHASAIKEIDALRVVCAKIADLYVFWCNHVGFCTTAQAESLDRRLGAFHGVFLRVPRADELEFEEEGCRYINTDYAEVRTTGAPLDDRHTRWRVAERLTAVWQEMTAMHAAVTGMWTLPGEEQKRYDAVRETALAAVRAWLQMPSFKGRRRREETGRRAAAQPTHEPRPAQYDMVGIWLKRLAECV